MHCDDVRPGVDSSAGLARSQPQGPEWGWGGDQREDQSGRDQVPPPPSLTLCRIEGLEARERLLIGVIGAEGDFQAGARRAEGVVAGRALRVCALRAAERGQLLGPGAQLGGRGVTGSQGETPGLTALPPPELRPCPQVSQPPACPAGTLTKSYSHR